MAIKDTLNLPKTDFPMKANLAQREPEILDFWESIGLYKKIQNKAKGKTKFVLHDGPPYANGDIHVGHTLNKVIKDIIVKYKSMQGFDAPYVPGWDTHGQPIEHNVLKKLGDKRKSISDVELRKKCHDYAMEYVDRQREEFKRLGVRGDWEKPYLTLDPVYESTNIKIFKDLFKKGLIYKGKKPIHWCNYCSTALAEAEIEYSDERSPSIYLKFRVKDDKGKLADFKDVDFMVWTTTPWTLPANVALALDPDGEYILVDSNGEHLLILKDLAQPVFKELERPYKELKIFSGKELQGIKVSHPLFDRESVVVLADFISREQGTGVVHIAPGHGQEDYLVGLEFDLPMPMPVDDKGVFTDEAERFEGQDIYKGNKSIVKELDDRNILLKLSFIEHSYPHCWRCRKPVIFRATEQWFVSMDKADLRKDALKEIKNVDWIPAWSQSRIESMVSERPDWCISRQRVWGVPLPVFVCKDCNEVLVNVEAIEAVEKLFEKEGADSWYKKDAAEILPAGSKCEKCNSSNIGKEMNILDVWFESGISQEAVLKTRADLSWPADLYVEGSDQHRGWFQSSLLISVGHQKKAPYKSVLTHGFVVDDQGRKMSKSLGNVVDPLDVIKQSGADILRLWVAASDFTTDVAISAEILKRTSEAYRRLRNTLRFLLANLYDFDESKAVDFSDLREIDKWALGRLQLLNEKVQDAFDDYKFHTVFHSIHNFAVVDLSAFYLDILKDTLYTVAADSKKRRSAQTVLKEILLVMTKLLTPILAFTSEEVWNNLPFEKKEETVQLSAWPEPKKELVDNKLDEKFNRLREVRDEVLKALEEARVKKVIGNPLEAKVILQAPEKLKSFLDKELNELPELFIVSEASIGQAKGAIVFSSERIKDLIISVDKTKHVKCERCWRYVAEVTKVKDMENICPRCADVIKEGNG